MNKGEKELLNSFINMIKVAPIFGICEINDKEESIIFTAQPKYEIKFTHDSYEYLKRRLKENDGVK